MEENRNNQSDELIESVFREIEFPGEDQSAINNYLEQAQIPERVHRKLTLIEDRKHKLKLFMIVAFCAFGLLLVLGANQYVIEFLFFFQGAVLLFITVALSAICLSGIVGILFNLDKKRLELNLKHLSEGVGDFLHKLFRP